MYYWLMLIISYFEVSIILYLMTSHHSIVMCDGVDMIWDNTRRCAKNYNLVLILHLYWGMVRTVIHATSLTLDRKGSDCHTKAIYSSLLNISWIFILTFVSSCIYFIQNLFWKDFSMTYAMWRIWGWRDSGSYHSWILIQSLSYLSLTTRLWIKIFFWESLSLSFLMK